MQQENRSAADGAAAEAFEKLYQTVVKLRSPEGCPWDREQTPLSLREDLLEETYECLEALNEKKPDHIREELGDIFLLVTMISYMHEQDGAFTVADALAGITEKLIRRHPHVFGDVTVKNSEEVLDNWARIKVEQEGRRPKDSLLDGVSTALPVLDRAYKLQKKAAGAGFDWPDVDGIFDKLAEETEEVRSALVPVRAEEKTAAAEQLEAELGDLLFTAVNLCRRLGVEPSVALQRTNSKFIRRFKYVEENMKRSGTEMKKENSAMMDRLWNEAKSTEH